MFQLPTICRRILLGVSVPLVWVDGPQLLTQGTSFGSSLAMDGETVVVQSSDTYIYEFSGGSWNPSGFVKASGHVSLYADTMLVGDLKATGGGAAEVFVKEGAVWTIAGHLQTAPSGTAPALGRAVALAGDTAVVTAVDEDPFDGCVPGRAYAFVRSAGAWSLQAELVAQDAEPLECFGACAAISGDTVVIGAPPSQTAMGAAYVFVRSDSTWSQQARFKAYSSLENFGASVDADGDTVVVGTSSTMSGQPHAAYVYTRSGASWFPQTKLVPSVQEQYQKFGHSVAVSGDVLVVGAPNQYGFNLAGAVFVYVRDGAVWHERQLLTSPVSHVGDLFGSVVGVSQNRILAGAQSSIWSLLGVGQGCSNALDCDTGRCVDGVCCDRACAGTCESCSMAGQEGRCRALEEGTDADTCPTPLVCGVGAVCGFDSGRACESHGQCANGRCVDGRCCDQACSGACDRCDGAQLGWPGAADGVCTVAPHGYVGSPVCPSYRCDGTNAGCDAASCATDDDCAIGFVCSEGSFTCVSAAATCDGNHLLEGPGGTQRDCYPYRCVSANTCLAACSSRADCVEGLSCDPEGRCVREVEEAGKSDPGCDCKMRGNLPPAEESAWLVGLVLGGCVVTRRRTDRAVRR